MANLSLYALCFSEEALLDVQPLETALATADIVHPCGAVLDRSLEEVFGVGPYVLALGLY